MVQLKKLLKSYGTDGYRRQVLNGIDLSIQKGEMVSIMGAPGSGKSTLLNIIGILDSYDAGEYYLENELIGSDAIEKKSAYYRNRHIGFVFQSFNLISYKTVLDNVAIPLNYPGVKQEKRESIAMRFLEYMSLEERASHLPAQLTGGQQQRAAIARALITNPHLLLADEPTGALDSATSNEIMNIFNSINKAGMTIIIATHEETIARKTGRVVRLEDGLITADTSIIR